MHIKQTCSDSEPQTAQGWENGGKGNVWNESCGSDSGVLPGGFLQITAQERQKEGGDK